MRLGAHTDGHKTSGGAAAGVFRTTRPIPLTRPGLKPHAPPRTSDPVTRTRLDRAVAPADDCFPEDGAPQPVLPTQDEEPTWTSGAAASVWRLFVVLPRSRLGQASAWLGCRIGPGSVSYSSGVRITVPWQVGEPHSQERMPRPEGEPGAKSRDSRVAQR